MPLARKDQGGAEGGRKWRGMGHTSIPRWERLRIKPHNGAGGIAAGLLLAGLIDKTISQIGNVFQPIGLSLSCFSTLFQHYYDPPGVAASLSKGSEAMFCAIEVSEEAVERVCCRAAVRPAAT